MESQTIKYYYGASCFVISSDNKFLSIKLNSSKVDRECLYEVWFGRIEKNDVGEIKLSLLSSKTGVFNEGIDSNAVLWPGDLLGDRLFSDLYIQWSEGGKEFGYLKFPKDLKLCFGSNFP